MMNYTLIKKFLIVIIILVALIFSLYFYKNGLLVELILYSSLIVILFLTKKENKFEDYAPFIIVIILGVFAVYQLVTSPKAEIDIDIIEQFINPPKAWGDVTNVIKLNKFEAYSISHQNYSYFPINNLNCCFEENSTPNNQYYITITNNGTMPISFLNIHLYAPFNINDEDIISTRGITFRKDKGLVSYGNVYLTTDFLGVGESASILFENKYIGDIEVNKCLMNGEMISCDKKVYYDFLIRIPKNRTITVSKGKGGISRELIFPIFNENGIYKLMDDGRFEYRGFIPIPPVGMGASLCSG